VADRNLSRRSLGRDVRSGDRPSDRRTVQGGRRPTMKHPKPQGPVNIGKLTPDVKGKTK
jgi:hypothetical protein